jgi:hypothetical protein
MAPEGRMRMSVHIYSFPVPMFLKQQKNKYERLSYILKALQLLPDNKRPDCQPGPSPIHTPHT